MTSLILLDADVLGRQRTGDETYVENLLRELPAIAPELRFAAVTRRPELVPDGSDAVELPARSQIVRMGAKLPRLLRRLRPDVAHFQYVLPSGAPSSSVVTVHDLSFEVKPELVSARDRLLFRALVPRAVRSAARVLTVSEWTKRDLVERYRIDPDRVIVTPNGVDPVFVPNGPSLNDGPAYALFVGALQPRKDPLTALAALALVPELRLRFVGPEKRDGRSVHRAAQQLGLADRVEFLGHRSKHDLAALYREAACLVLPSRYEGFGLPVLEAMACGTPVVTTTAGALPEVAGDAAILVEPGDAPTLAAGIEQALADRERLVAAGLARARLFSWTTTARKTLEVYRELL